MNALRKVLIAFLSVGFLAAGAASATSTTDFSDQWLVPSESGWGAAVLQQSSTLFVNLMVYGLDGKPTWFVVAAPLQSNAPQGHTVFSGDLYATTGPYYGGAWNAAALGARKVGTLTFDATSAYNATISYSVDGVPVTKDVVRQVWATDNLTGKYAGAWNNYCGGAFWVTWTITHNADNSITMLVEDAPPPSFGYFIFHGTYTQRGHLGEIVADLQTPDSGSMTFTEIEKTAYGFVGRMSGRTNGCVVADGRFAASSRGF